MLEDEEWRDVLDFPGFKVSTHGRVKTTHRGRPREPIIDEFGRLLINLRLPREEVGFLLRLDKIVLLTFVGWPTFYTPIDPEVFHIDGDPHNCRLDNLRWTSDNRVWE